jgi:hypothetical protein
MRDIIWHIPASPWQGKRFKPHGLKYVLALRGRWVPLWIADDLNVGDDPGGQIFPLCKQCERRKGLTDGKGT